MAMQPDAKRSKPVFPETLAGFGYRFKDGKLQNVDTGEGFNFAVKENNQAYNQAHYEALGEVMDQHVYGLLTQECGLKRVPVPIEGNGDQPNSFIFASDNWKTCDRLMILIHGSGVVRAGQWARRLIINDCLNSGTQMPYIHRAKCEGYGVLVLNTNHNRAVDESGRTWPIRGSEDPTRHADTVWRQYVLQSSANHIAIVAHSYGGCVATHLFTQFTNDFNNRVFAVALTDSVHMINNPVKFCTFMKRSCNWVSSNLPLDTDMSHRRLSDVPTVSAGVTAHEMTSWGCFNSVFEFFGNRYHDKTNKHIPMAREEDYLFYPPSPPVRPELQQERVESLPLPEQAVALQAAGSTSGASYKGAVGGGDNNKDDQEQPSEDERRSLGDRRREREDQESVSDSGSQHHNDRREEGRDDDKHRRRHYDEVHKESEDQENVSDHERHNRLKGRREQRQRDEERDRAERHQRREERRLARVDREIISDSERNQHSNDRRKEEEPDDDEEKINRRRRREERRGEQEDREIISDSERNQHSHDGRKEEELDEDKNKRRRRREERKGKAEGREIISDSERKHHSNDGRKEEEQDDDKEKNKRHRRREEKRLDREHHDSEHSHRSNKSNDQDSDDHSHHRSDKRRSIDRRHGHGASSDSGHSSGRHHKKNRDDERRRSSRNNKNDDEDGNGAEGDEGETIEKRKDREGKKDATTKKESSDDESQQRNEQTRRGGKVESSQGGCRRSEHREERRSRGAADKGQEQKQDGSQEGDEGSDAESSGDEKDSTVNQGRSEHEDKSRDDISGDEGVSCEKHFTHEAMEQDNKDAKSVKVGLAIQNESADKHGQTAAKDRASEDGASKDSQGAYAKTKQAEPAEDGAIRHRSESGASDSGDEEDKFSLVKRKK